MPNRLQILYAEGVIDRLTYLVKQSDLRITDEERDAALAVREMCRDILDGRRDRETPSP